MTGLVGRSGGLPAGLTWTGPTGRLSVSGRDWPADQLLGHGSVWPLATAELRSRARLASRPAAGSRFCLATAELRSRARLASRPAAGSRFCLATGHCGAAVQGETGQQPIAGPRFRLATGHCGAAVQGETGQQASCWATVLSGHCGAAIRLLSDGTSPERRFTGH